jgi:hypothetical protein
MMNKRHVIEEALPCVNGVDAGTINAVMQAVRVLALEDAHVQPGGPQRGGELMHQLLAVRQNDNAALGTCSGSSA